MVLIHTEIEIEAPPAKFLDFPRLSEWHSGHFKELVISSQDGSIKPGDTVKVALEGQTFNGSILENTPEQLMWRGSLPLVFTGDHFFRFEPSETKPGGTRFVQGEEFSGLLSFMMGNVGGYGFGPKTKGGFEKLNADLKKRCEEK
ncbi:hypothetical protein CAC42_5976 [Sphaceloma murrayae]|uniref:Uncharacterized protein n=1 Tax=Sphaceloma murrayae TaxID=2082308 RepID=A0A2K1QZR9_9PEZI|nr:hypothetical protein CAC42_5976 [Sphaceloma murrayae]